MRGKVAIYVAGIYNSFQHRLSRPDRYRMFGISTNQ